jgi:hypothetical protein
MAALRKLFLPAAIIAAAAGSSANAEEEDASALVRAMEGGTSCVLSAGKNGADTSRFDNNEVWQKQDDGSYSASGQPVKVTFPADADGVSRICVVEATLESQKQQKEMRVAFEALLKQKPIEQKDSMIWMFGTVGNSRGLQFFPDAKSDQPKIRLIGAAF